MNISKLTYKIVFILGFLLSTALGFSQSDKQKQLESRRQELRREIQKINEAKRHIIMKHFYFLLLTLVRVCNADGFILAFVMR